MMLKTNEARLVELAMQCKPGPPRIRPGWRWIMGVSPLFFLVLL